MTSCQGQPSQPATKDRPHLPAQKERPQLPGVARVSLLTSHLRTSPMTTLETPQVEHKSAKTPLSEQGDVKEEGSVLRYATDD